MAEGKIHVDFRGMQKGEARQLARVAILLSDGFADGEVEILKHHRLYPCDIHNPDGTTRKTTVVYNLRRRRWRQVAKLARVLGLDPKDRDQFDEAAQEFRARANKVVDAWHDEGYTGLPPEYDPTALMGYAKYA